MISPASIKPAVAAKVLERNPISMGLQGSAHAAKVQGMK
jgi:hypothetical protein